MGKYMGNVPRLLDINAKCTDVKFPDVRGIVDLVMLPEMEDPHSSFSSSATDGMRDESSSLHRWQPASQPASQLATNSRWEQFVPTSAYPSSSHLEPTKTFRIFHAL